MPVVGGIPDFAPHIGAGTGKQRVMETRLFARVYETRLWRRLHTRLGSGRSLDTEIEEVLSFSPPPRRAADLACGTGPYTRAIAARWPGVDVVGLDLSPAMLEEARRLAKLPFLRADAARLPFPDGHLDLVNCAGALHLLPDPVAVIREVARVLRPGGAFVGMTTGRRRLDRPSLQAVFERRLSIRFFDPDVFSADLAAAGFRDVRLVHHRGAMLFGALRA